MGVFHVYGADSNKKEAHKIANAQIEE